MIIGVHGSVFALWMSILADATSGPVVIALLSGAIFGKGHGVWEERARTALSDDKETP
jgi:hypothetical protein